MAPAATPDGSPSPNGGRALVNRARAWRQRPPALEDHKTCPGAGRLRCGARRGLLLARWLPVERCRRAFRGQVFPPGESGGVPAPAAAVRRLRRARRAQRPQKPSRRAFPPARGRFRCRQQLSRRSHAGAVMSARSCASRVSSAPARRREWLARPWSPRARAGPAARPRELLATSSARMERPLSLVPRPVEDAARAARPRTRRSALRALRAALVRGIAT